jgi:cytochrome c oxidase cbb3-type subunit III
MIGNRVHPGVTALVVLALAACKRETRDFRADPPVAAALNHVAPLPNRINGAVPYVIFAQGDPYGNNAYQLNQGKRLYTWFNCKGCHADGGGVIGPALMDGWWRYGPDRVSVFLSIRDGRPHGMPAFGDRLTAEQIWQLTGYVRTIGGYSGKTAAPSRNDEMQSRPSENRAPAAASLSMPPSR